MLKSLLPQPVHITSEKTDNLNNNDKISDIPAYGQRRHWRPKTEHDFGDGGAFPEIHIVQYPLGIGKPQQSSAHTSNSLIKQLDVNGRVAYDAIAKQGHSHVRNVHAKITDVIPKEIVTENDPSLARPGQDEIDETTKKTQLALFKFQGEIYGSSKPIKEIQKRANAQYIRYTPAMQGFGHNSGASQRIIRMVEAPLDPMEPPRYKTNKKIPKAAPSPPAPVLHSPPRKLSQADQQRWKIPPCISNWRNPKGYTIPLDKRLAADGRGLQETIINEGFAKMSEALNVADRKAREAVEMRNKLEKQMAQREKEKKEQQLRQLAQKAREERAGLVKQVSKGLVSHGLDDSSDDSDQEQQAEVIKEDKNLTKEDKMLVQERKKIAQDKSKERQRERNLQRAAPSRRAKILQNDNDRDITEKIALNLPTKKKAHKEVVYDQRLFNQTQGLDSGFDRVDDTYNVYTERWNETGDSRVAKNVYRPKGDDDGDIYGNDIEQYKSAKQFVADKGFEGAVGKSNRSGPVQFERDQSRSETADPFGLDAFLATAKSNSGPSAKKPRI